MKRSNLILIIALVIAVSWFLISGWLQISGYKLLKEGKPCSYLENLSKPSVIQLKSFRNIKIVFQGHSVLPIIGIYPAKNCELKFSTILKKAISYSIVNDTLLMNLNYVVDKPGDHIYIKVPQLNNVTLVSDPLDKWEYLSDWGHVSITDFEENTLSVNNDCKFRVSIEGNKLRKLVLMGEFTNNGKAEISGYQDCDTLDVDIRGKQGKLSLSTWDKTKVTNPKQVISIKVPSTFIVNAEASLADKIIAKK
jgi:hypothetical protein